jgi:DNA-binding CsgD family transcriptional regulator
MLHRELGYTWHCAEPLHMLGYIARVQGDYDRASRLFEEAMDIARQQGDERGRVSQLRELGVIAIERGDYDRAAACLQESLRVCRELGDVRGIAVSQENLAWLAAIQGQPVEAARLFGAAEALLESTGARLMPYLRADYERRVAIARDLLDEPTFNAAWEGGRATIIAHESPSPAHETTHKTTESRQRRAGLTPREADVLRLVAQGLTDAQIAEHLVISPRTASSHLSSIYSKLGVSSRTAAARFAIEHGLV